MARSSSLDEDVESSLLQQHHRLTRYIDSFASPIIIYQPVYILTSRVLQRHPPHLQHYQCRRVCAVATSHVHDHLRSGPADPQMTWRMFRHRVRFPWSVKVTRTPNSQPPTGKPCGNCRAARSESQAQARLESIAETYEGDDRFLRHRASSITTTTA